MPAGACPAERSRTMQETRTHRHGGAPVWPRCCGCLNRDRWRVFPDARLARRGAWVRLSGGWPRCVITHAALGWLPGAATSDASVRCWWAPACSDLAWGARRVGRPVRGDCGPGAKVGGRGNRLAANVLEVVVVVEVSDREDARGFDSGRFALLVDSFLRRRAASS